MHIRSILRDLIANESGQDLIEYAMVAALVGLGVLTAMHGLSGKISNAFGTIGNTLTTNV